MRTNGRRLLRPIALTLVAEACLAGWASPGQAQTGEPHKKLNRELRIVEELFNDVLIDSPNWLVSGGGPAHAAYVDGIGLVIGFEASLVGRDMLTIGNDEKFWASRHEKRDERHYTRGKAELREALVDCGDALTQLQDEDWVVVTVYLDDDDYFDDRGISRYCLKVKTRELRAAADADLTPEQMAVRLNEVEY
jgi:hypothetical protein